MITTENLGLVVWDQEKDDFEHSQLANNWVRVDTHDHAGVVTFPSKEDEDAEEFAEWKPIGHGLPIRTASILPYNITRLLLALRAVGHFQIGLDEVWEENLESGAATSRVLASESVTDPKIAKETITIDKFEPGLLSLGSVMLWYRPSGSGNTPGEIWHACDGTPWKEIKGNRMGSGGSELTTGSIPNMNGQFAKGSSITSVGGTGGSATVNLEHSHVVNAHTHVVENHSHGLANHVHSISVDGKHGHTFEGGYVMHSRKNAFASGLTLETHENTLQSLYGATFNEGGGDHTFNMDQTGEHQHTGLTGAAGGGETGGATPGTSATAPGTNSALSSVQNVEPPYTNFLYIMRVK